MPRFAEARRRATAVVVDAARAVERHLLPAECLLCLDPVGRLDPDALVCPLCRSRWRPVADPVCARCGQPATGIACRICAEWPAGLEQVRSAVWLEAGARKAVHQLKYGGWPGVAGAMAGAMRGLAPLTAGVFLIPVPLGRRRRRERGYNQSERLATALGELTGLPTAAGLRRTRETPTQTALTPEARLANVAGAFEAEVPKGASVVVVDDVFTTGATLVAAAAALVEAGADRVAAVTFARAPLPV